MIHTAFRPGDDQDPTDERGEVIYDSGVTLFETWQALERLVDEGHCKSIGLSDVTLETLREIFGVARIKPASQRPIRKRATIARDRARRPSFAS
jgi:diketogulonate reductase-like aldo/keto reductase